MMVGMSSSCARRVAPWAPEFQTLPKILRLECEMEHESGLVRRIRSQSLEQWESQWYPVDQRPMTACHMM